MDEIKSENINIGFWTKFLKHERDGFMVYPRLAPEFRTIELVDLSALAPAVVCVVRWPCY